MIAHGVCCVVEELGNLIFALVLHVAEDFVEEVDIVSPARFKYLLFW